MIYNVEYNYSEKMRFLALIIFLTGHIVIAAQDNSFYYYNEFNSGLQDSYLKISNEDDNIWQIGYPTKDFFAGTVNISPPSIMTDTINNYPINNYSYFEIDFGNTIFHQFYQFFNIYFQFKIQSDSGNDGGFLDISYDGGTTWENIVNDSCINKYGELQGYSNFYSVDDTLVDGTPSFSGQSEEWIRAGVSWAWSGFDYPWIDSNGVKLKIRFIFKSDSIEDDMAGWIIDNINLDYSWYESVEKISNFVPSKIYPNPVENESILQLENTLKEKILVEIYNSYGILLKSTIINEDNLHILNSDFKQGIYFYQATYYKTNKKSIGKFIIK
jgi:hypothetical protein